MFQFTHPGKGATEEFRYSWVAFNRFQFTHPGKGATALGIKFYSRSEVSIHAPWEGCDAFSLATTESGYTFQFTHPGKGATPHSKETFCSDSVSIHAPWEGCDSVVQSCVL